MSNEMLDAHKAKMINPFSQSKYDPPVYLQPGSTVSVSIDTREQEVAILAAYDYGLDALTDDGKQQIEFLIANLKVAITGR